MLINGKLLYGNKELFNKLKIKARYYNNKENKKDIMKYYHAWDMYDEYKACKYHKELPYYMALKELIEAYMYNNNYNLLPVAKIEKIFKDRNYRKRYKLNNFPNNIFNILVINCFNNPIEKNLDKLYNYVMNDANFNINNFKIRNKLNEE